jgi:hypothetical protein
MSAPGGSCNSLEAPRDDGPRVAVGPAMDHTTRVRSRCPALLLVLAGCSAPSNGSSFAAGGSAEDASVADAGTDADANANACVVDGGPGVRCSESLASYCAPSGNHAGFSNGGCTTTLQSAQANPPCASADGLQTMFESCGPLELLSMSGIDFGTTYFYEAASGELIAITSLSDPQGVSCVAGPPCLAIPNCGAPQVVCDAGADALAQQ